VTERMSVEEFKALKSAAPRRKYRNTPTTVDGWKFDSKLEARRYVELKMLQAGGHVAWFLCQVPFRLPGHIIYRADFMICWWDGSARLSVEDCKGVSTRVSTNKIKQVEELYGLKVTIVRPPRSSASCAS
jgi:hypothetical protein